MKTLITNGHVVDPKNKIDEVLDVLIENGRIKKVSKGLAGSSLKADRVIDAKGKIVCPGQPSRMNRPNL